MCICKIDYNVCVTIDRIDAMCMYNKYGGPTRKYRKDGKIEA